MSNAGFSKEPSGVSPPPGEDIPEALRETPIAPPRPRSPRKFLGWAGVGLAIALVAGLLLRMMTVPPPALVKAGVPVTAGIQQALIRAGLPLTTSSLLGHLPYEEASSESLEAITADTRIKLRRPAAEKFTAMVASARAAGVTLVPLSGFRSIQEQEQVFFDLKAQRGERATERAEVSAPPGYSEHHTGYAIDILDGSRSETDLETTFDSTPAFRWLQENAAFFSFELSFPKENPQGVSYEPWHWRFVGDRISLETFYKARTVPLNRPLNRNEDSTR